VFPRRVWFIAYLTFVCSAILSCVLISSSGFAQSDTRSNGAENSPTLPPLQNTLPAEASTQESQMQEQIQRFKKLSKQMLERTNDESNDLRSDKQSESAENPAKPNDSVDRLLQEQQQRDNDASERFDMLRDRLSKIMSRQALKNIEKAKPADSVVDRAEASSDDKGQLPEGLTSERPTVAPSTDEIQISPKIVADQAGFKTTQILAKPVDRLALADSLFQSDEISLSFDLYKKLVEQAEGGKDRLWIEYQLAACARRLGSLDVARSHLRKVTESQSNDFPVPQARLWLEQLDASQSIKDRAGQLDLLIETLERKVNTK